MKYYRDKIVFLTGGASGIGKTLGIALAQYGAKLHIADIDQAALQDTVNFIQKRGGTVTGYNLDVRDAQAFSSAIAQVNQKDGALDILFNNAGVTFVGEAYHMQTDDWNRIIDVNIKGAVHGVRAVYPKMVERGSGQIVNISSLAGLIPFPGSTTYAMSKHAVVGLSHALRAEGKEKGVRVNVVCPGFIDTPILRNMPVIGMDRKLLLKQIKPVTVSVSSCVRYILRGVRHNRGVITIGWYAKMMWRLYRLNPRFFMDVIAPRTMQNMRKTGDPEP
ncbi:MAG: SDR family NAD(P)-dependent oxidoreductase [Myxococcota bacterium]|nr:SDR family NAD(P)-dependent oxidoreductase [Myxococcota bacterium]